MPSDLVLEIGQSETLSLSMDGTYTGNFDGSIIPASAFDAENTVKDYIDDVKNRVDYIEYNGIAYKNGVEGNYFFNVIRFDKSKYIANYALNTGNGSTSSTLLEYARNYNPIFCTNVSNSSSFVFDGTAYGEDYAAPSRAAFYCKHNASEEDFTIVRCDGTTTQRDMLALGWNFVGGAWQALVYGGETWEIDSYETFSQLNPWELFAWDSEYYYFAQIYGRMFAKPGITLAQAQSFAVSEGWPNCAVFDSGDSIREYFGERAPIAVSHKLNETGENRAAYYNLTIHRKTV